MKQIIFYIAFSFVSLCAVAQLTDTEISNLQSGHVKPDNSPVYNLLFTQSSKFLLIQAYNNKMSYRNELSLYFKIKQAVKFVPQGPEK
jgi:hypothetical protein